MRIEIEKVLNNLSKRRFVFWFDDSRETIWVDEFELLKRDTPRHKYKAIEQYKRLSSRSDLNNLSTSDIPLDDEIKQAAINEFVSRLKIDFWK